MHEFDDQPAETLDAALQHLLTGRGRPAAPSELADLIGIADRLQGLPAPAFRERLLGQLLPPRPAGRPGNGSRIYKGRRGVYMNAMQVPVDVVSAGRIGLIADNHSRQEDGGDLPRAALEALQGVDLIIHCGDTGHLGTLDRLGTIAPVLAVSGGHIEGGGGREDERVKAPTRVVQAGTIRIGVVHEIGKYGIAVQGAPEGKLVFPDTPMTEILSSKFGGPVDVVAFGGTHRDMVVTYQGVLLVNPGSPNLPARRATPDELGTVAILEVRGSVVDVQMVRLRGEVG